MWRQPTTDDFRGAILEAEMESYQSASVSDTIDPVATAMAQAVTVFRSALRSTYKGIIGVAGTLPNDLIAPAMHIAVYYFIGGRAGQTVSDTRTQLYRDAIRRSERIGDGREAFTDPDDDESTALPSDALPKPAVREKTLTLSRADQSGL